MVEKGPLMKFHLILEGRMHLCRKGEKEKFWNRRRPFATAAALFPTCFLHKILAELCAQKHFLLKIKVKNKFDDILRCIIIYRREVSSQNRVHIDFGTLVIYCPLVYVYYPSNQHFHNYGIIGSFPLLY